MASQNRFVYNSSTLDIGRSAWKMPFGVHTSMLHGDLVPLKFIEVQPGDSFNVDFAAVVRMSTPIAPIMGRITMSVCAFNIPKRLVWDKTKQFYGEAVDGYGIATAITEPCSTNANNTMTPNANFADSLASYAGLIRPVGSSGGLPININPLRAFYQVYNDWFRNENFMPPFVWNHGETGTADRAICTISGKSIYARYNGTDSGTADSIPKVCKKLDRFTSCLPWAQKSVNPVFLPLGETAPVGVFGSDGTFLPESFKYISTGTLSESYVSQDFGTGTGALHLFHQFAGDNEGIVHSATSGLNGKDLVADLSQATAATVNQLRLAFATQRYYEALARGGSRYREQIRVMYGVNIGDTTAQMAEYLGGITFDINVDQVLSTAGYAAGTSTNVGMPGANSVTSPKGSLFNCAIKEPGYIVIVAYTKHDRTYGQGIDEIFTKNSLFDYYNPKFANIGEVPIKKNALYYDGSNTDQGSFGFQEAWSEYRYIKDSSTGLLNPALSSSLNFWTLTENFATMPVLNQAFLEEDRNAIARALTTGSSGPDYICDFFFDCKVARPMPLESIPGLIDHH